MVLVTLAGMPDLAVGQVASSTCEGADEDPWIAEMHERMMRLNRFVAYAVEQHGPAATCRGAVTTEFDGGKYGEIELEFSEDVVFHIETMPIETSIVTLRATRGFEDEDAVRLLLLEYAAAIGLSIDWDAPEEATEAGERLETYWDPEPGLNASAQLIYRETMLVAVRLRMAL